MQVRNYRRQCNIPEIPIRNPLKRSSLGKSLSVSALSQQRALCPSKWLWIQKQLRWESQFFPLYYCKAFTSIFTIFSVATSKIHRNTPNTLMALCTTKKENPLRMTLSCWFMERVVTEVSLCHCGCPPSVTLGLRQLSFDHKCLQKSRQHRANTWRQWPFKDFLFFWDALKPWFKHMNIYSAWLMFLFSLYNFL